MDYKWHLVLGLPGWAVLVCNGKTTVHSREALSLSVEWSKGHRGVNETIAVRQAGLALIDAPPDPAAVTEGKVAELGRWCLKYAEDEFAGRGHSAWIGADSIMDQAVDLELGAMIAYDPKLHGEDRVVEDDQRFYFFGEGTLAWADPKWREVCGG